MVLRDRGMNDPCDPMGHHGHHPGLDGDMYHQHVPAARTKRMRTSFKHHQLRTMKSYFAMNHNPDAKDLKQLAHKTGLTKRVLQVWFQNARAKYRRTSTKKDDEKSEKNASECDGDQPSPSTQVDDQDNISITSSGGGGGSGSGSDPTADTMYDDGDEDDEDKLLDEITTYSELKTASPAVADEVSTISSMPASARMLHGLHGPPGPTPGNIHHGMGLMSHGFVEIFSNSA
ncbi:LIM/homeobox protein Lhx9-like [Strongylocentrotus purpuratus]|uniref:Homeobox domain-containing protein n=1 Tax=Strongylocentrotus purpuratus TaxID=7668 RepID=A0A7M7PMX5_STRPU|nr:LIM/homeobox protein Lhx9-like [Strongylocentrotus purpuratus]